jgi:hypothetical protein
MGAGYRSRTTWIMAMALLFWVVTSLPARAHLMVAQKGTLKYGEGGFFFVLSLPVSSISGFDDDGDGLLSGKELQIHSPGIEAAIHQGFVLESTTEGPRIIEGLLLNMAHDHGHSQQPATHVVAMGRFSVATEDRALTLKTSLFGKQSSEQRFEITITRGDTKEVAVLTKTQPDHSLFSKK